MTQEISLEDRKVIYRARRGLKELDYYFDPYVKQHYLQADDKEKAVFRELINQEDPDLLDWFMDASQPSSEEFAALIARIKALVSPFK